MRTRPLVLTACALALALAAFAALRPSGSSGALPAAQAASGGSRSHADVQRHRLGRPASRHRHALVHDRVGRRRARRLHSTRPRAR